MGKTRDFSNKIGDTKGTFHAKMGTIKDRNSKDLTEEEEIKKRRQEYTGELYKKGLNDPGNHDAVVTHLEPDILECEVKWVLGSITMNKVSKGDCQEPARDIPLVTKVMRKEARHTQRWDRASGVPPDILEHLPPKDQSLPTLLPCTLTSDFTGGCPPPPSRSIYQRVNLQLQLINFLGN